DGSCEMPGCTNVNACNFDAAAECDNNSCVFPGCTDSAACNFEPQAGCDDGSCQSSGCTDATACNYDVDAGCDNNSCEFPGCMDSTKCNYNPSAGCDNNSCIQFCCNNPLAVNYLLPSYSAVDCYFSPEIVIFHDENANGSLDDGELGLPNRPVSIEIINSETIVVYSNGSGHVQYLFSEDQLLVVALAPAQDTLWSHIDEDFVSDTITVFDTLYLPLQPIDSLAYSLFAFDGLSNHIDCVNGYNGGVIVNNFGGDTIVVNMTTDISELVNLGYQVSDLNLFETISWIDNTNNTLTWNDTILPGQIELLTFTVFGGGTENGAFDVIYNLQISDESGDTQGTTIIKSLEIYCDESASDGGLIASPIGLFEPNFIIVGDTIIYTIQFNYDGDPSRFDDCPGDSVAYRVLVSDTVDGFSMVPNSIQPLANSHESV
ncbi:MAG: hypothetical protein ACKOW8_09535, partial [Flavobacteriales bacterium]